MRTIARSRGNRAKSAPATPKPIVISPSAAAQSASDNSDNAPVTGIGYFLCLSKSVARDFDWLADRGRADDRLEHGDAVQDLLGRDRVGLLTSDRRRER